MGASEGSVAQAVSQAARVSREGLSNIAEIAAGLESALNAFST
jgi:hypothetical protein